VGVAGLTAAWREPGMNLACTRAKRRTQRCWCAFSVGGKAAPAGISPAGPALPAGPIGWP
jgi:hypothetical protein